MANTPAGGCSRLSAARTASSFCAPALWRNDDVKGAAQTMKSRKDQLAWAKQRALVCVDMGDFTDAVAGLRADLAENSLTRGVISSDQMLRGYKAAMDAALGRGSEALTEWIEGIR
jgi:hypothetical protein